MNTWPNGHRRELTHGEHERWNAANYPGTRQLCECCGDPTERCEDDSLYVGDVGPVCQSCADAQEAERG